MVHKVLFENLKKIKAAIPLIESKIKVKIMLMRGHVMVKGEEYNEYLADKVLRAADFGFEVEDALLLLKEDFNLEFINMKEHTKKKNLVEVRARVIGTAGKAKRTIEELSGGVIVVKGNTVGLIVDNEHLSQAVQGVVSLIQGSKHSNVFSYLEKQNANLNKRDIEDLGLKDKRYEKYRFSEN